MLGGGCEEGGGGGDISPFVGGGGKKKKKKKKKHQKKRKKTKKKKKKKHKKKHTPKHPRGWGGGVVSHKHTNPHTTPPKQHPTHTFLEGGGNFCATNPLGWGVLEKEGAKGKKKGLIVQDFWAGCLGGKGREKVKSHQKRWSHPG